MQAIYKFDDRRIVAGRIRSGHLDADDEIVIMPAGKIAKIKTVELAGDAAEKQSDRGPLRRHALDRELCIERGDVIGHSRRSPRDTRRIRARIFWLHDRLAVEGEQILIRLGTRETRATVVAIRGDRSRALQRGDAGDRPQPCRRDRHLAGAAGRGRSLHGKSAHWTPRSRSQRRIAGGGLICRSMPVSALSRSTSCRSSLRCAPRSDRRDTATAAR